MVGVTNPTHLYPATNHFTESPKKPQNIFSLILSTFFFLPFFKIHHNLKILVGGLVIQHISGFSVVITLINIIVRIIIIIIILFVSSQSTDPFNMLQRPPTKVITTSFIGYM